MVDKKDLIIVVPGVKFADSSLKLFGRFALQVYRLTHIKKPFSVNYDHIWKQPLKNDGNDTIILHWSRGITFFSEYFAVKKLKRLIRHYALKRNIKIVAFSLGGEIALRAIKDLSPKEVSKVILVCSTNGQTALAKNKIPIANIYSPFDLFAKLSTEFIAPIHGGMKLFGKNVKNISLRGMNHEDFCEDLEVKFGIFKGKKIIKIVEENLA